MRLQQRLQLERDFDGHITYQHRSGKFVYFFGYHGGVITYQSDKNQSEWTGSEIDEAINYYRSEVARLKSEALLEG